MIVKKLSVYGYRGFATEQVLNFAMPCSGKPGSGLTIIVGANNSGKSTVIEALAAAVRQPEKLHQGHRNDRTGRTLKIVLSGQAENGTPLEHTLSLAGSSGSRTQMVASGTISDGELMRVPSRRTLQHLFSGQRAQREAVGNQLNDFTAGRRLVSGSMENGLFTLTGQTAKDKERRDKFDALLERIVGHRVSWAIDTRDGEERDFIEIVGASGKHSSEGMGDGLVSLMFIVFALFEIPKGQVLAIDEPELSLHPRVLRELFTVLKEIAEDNQVVLSTHSPYLLDWDSVVNGATVARVYTKPDSGCVIKQLIADPDLTGQIDAVLNDTHNPHVLGLDANEVFFRHDGVVLLEGQEDVIYMPRVIAALNAPPNDAKIQTKRASFFGWGSGSARKVPLVATLLQRLGYERVFALFDKCDDVGQEQVKSAMDATATILNGAVGMLPARDVRYKEPKGEADAEKHASLGEDYSLLNKDGTLRPKHVGSLKEVFKRVDEVVV